MLRELAAHLGKPVPVPVQEGRFIFSTALPGSGTFFALGTPASGLRAVLKRGKKEMEVEVETNDPGLIKGDPDDLKTSFDIIRTSLNLILAMEVQPLLIERGRQVKHVKRHREAVLWTPNRIGRGYRIKVLDTSGVEKGSHSSPRMHWRRGHWRRQGFGKRVRLCICGHDVKRHGKLAGECFERGCDCLSIEYQALPAYEAYRTRWIEPILVNAKAGV
jgi:hypothetical protein